MATVTQVGIVNGTPTSGTGEVSTIDALITVVAAHGGALTPVVSAAAESNHVMKGAAGTLFDWHVTTGAVAGYVMIFNLTSAPADGAVTPSICVAVAPNQSVMSSNMAPTAFSTGITMVFSSTGPFTKTASATAFFSAKVA